MDVRLTLSDQQTIVYPQANTAEDRGGVVKGFIELECKQDVKIDALRLRLICLVNTVADAERALATNGGADGFVIRPSTLFLRDVELSDLETKQPIDAANIQAVKKGKTVYPFQVTVPSTCPGSQHHTFHKVNYELLLFVRGRPVKGFLSLPFTYAPVQPVFINVHPSATGMRGLNTVDLELRPTSFTPKVSAMLSSGNARFGGCFHLNTYFDLNGKSDASSVIVHDLEVRLEQCFIVRGKRIEQTLLTTKIADSSQIRKNLVEFRNEGSQHLNHDQSDTLPHEKAGLPSYESSECRSKNVQRVEVYSFFPSGGKTIADKSDMAGPLREWQASTPINTKDDLRVEHMLYYSVTFTDPAQAQQTATFVTPLCMVKEDMRTEAVQLPQYSASIDMLDEKGFPMNLPPPPNIDAIM